MNILSLLCLLFQPFKDETYSTLYKESVRTAL